MDVWLYTTKQNYVEMTWGQLAAKRRFRREST
jgi:hypothetical protein